MAGPGDGPAARDHRDDGGHLHELVAVEVEQCGEECRYRKQAHQRGQRKIIHGRYMILARPSSKDSG